jgi:hypothetical protein
VQQSAVFTLALAETQHACGGVQQSSPAAQQSSPAAGALTAAKQHACGGLQQAASGPQQLAFGLVNAPLQAAPPPSVPRSRARGANNFRVIVHLQSFK